MNNVFINGFPIENKVKIVGWYDKEIMLSFKIFRFYLQFIG